MTVNDAIEILRVISAGSARWGKHYSHKPTYTDAQLYAALGSLDTVVQELELQHKEEVTKLNRQLAASKAREAKLKGGKGHE